MSRRKRFPCTTVLSGILVIVVAAPAVAQYNRRGFSSRGSSPASSRSSNLRGPVVTGSSRYGYNFGGNTLGPLGGATAYGYSAPFYFNYPSDVGQSDMYGQTDAATMGESATPSSRPNVRPRLNVTERDAINSNRVLRDLRQSVMAQVAGLQHRPFTPPWYAARPQLSPPGSLDNAWQPATWTAVCELLDVASEPQSYDCQPDDRGLIYVYREGLRRQRAVDQRGPAIALAESGKDYADPQEVLTTGVFAAVPPTDQPVTSLLHIALYPSGAVTGYQYDLQSDLARRLRGAVDIQSQQIAWQIGDDYAETGLVNLTEDLGRFLLFRADGWTQPWILMRLAVDQQPAPAEPSR